MEIEKEEYYTKAVNELGKIYHRNWLPSGETKASLILVHGMAEHADRFDSFASYLAKNNVAVYSIDLPGHGKSTQPTFDFGPNSTNAILNELRHLFVESKLKNSDTPIFILGNSLGTAIARLYLSKYEQVKGTILVSTMNRIPIAKISRIKAKIIWAIKGPNYRSKGEELISFTPFLRNKKHKNSKTPTFWDFNNLILQFTKFKMAVGTPYTIRSYYYFYKMVENSTNKKWAKEISTQNSFLLLSGDNDPVGNFGKSIDEIGNDLTKNKIYDVTKVLLPKYNHEVLQNPKYFEKPSQIILNWIEERI